MMPATTTPNCNDPWHTHRASSRAAGLPCPGCGVTDPAIEEFNRRRAAARAEAERRCLQVFGEIDEVVVARTVAGILFLPGRESGDHPHLAGMPGLF